MTTSRGHRDPHDLPDLPDRSERTPLRLSTETDVLAFVPYSLGFLPHDSVAMVAVTPGGTPMVARVDLSADRDVRAAAAAEISRAAALNSAHHALLVAYTDDPGRALTAVDELTEALGEWGVTVGHAFRADGSRWFTLLPEDAQWTVGSPYDLTTHHLSSRAVLEGRVTYADRDGLAASLDPADPDLVDEVAEALEERAPLPSGTSPSHDRAHLREEARWAAAWVRDRVAQPVEVPRWPSATDVARLLRVLEVDEARQVVLAEVTRGTARAQVALWRAVARLAPAGHRAHASAMLAFAAWLDGDGALAWCAVDRTREADPDHELCALVAETLENAVPPTAWTPLDPATLGLLSG